MKINPKSFGLPTRTVFEQNDDNSIAIVITRKSQIMMADGKKIMEKARKIKFLKSETIEVQSDIQ